MPEFCKDGLYKKIVEDKLEERKLKKEKINEEIKERKITVPFYSHMLPRFQNYMKKKVLNQQKNLGKSLDSCTFRPNILKNEPVSNYGNYFKTLHQNFEKELSKKKNSIMNDLQKKSYSLEPFRFLKQRENVKNHNCFSKVDNENFVIKLEKSKPIPKKIILEKELFPDKKSKSNFVKKLKIKPPQIPKKPKIEKEQIKNQKNIKFKSLISSKTKKNLNPEKRIRKIALDKEDFYNCEYNN